MLNPNTNIRELAYLVTVDEIREIPGYDRICQYRVGGWWLVSGKGDYQVGDTALYIEIDSLCPYNEQFSFLDKLIDENGKTIRPDRHKIKTQRFAKGTALSQGLLCPLKDFPQLQGKEVGYFCTEELGITYYEVEDNVRKASNEQLTNMKVEKKLERWCKKHKFLSKFKFIINWKRNSILNKIKKQQQKKKSDSGWPTGRFPGVSKTDQERCENMVWVLEDKSPYIKTLKIDGTSSTYILERLKKNKFEYYVCSRNVRMMSRDQKNFHSDEENVYWDASDTFKIKEFLEDYLNKNNLDWVCVQGEIAGKSLKGAKIQGDPHNLNQFKFFGFHMTDSKNGRLNPLDASKLCHSYGIDWVPILDDNYIMPNDFEEFKLSADGKCDLPNSNGLREGFVYYKKENPSFSFKNVSREYLLKHN